MGDAHHVKVYIRDQAYGWLPGSIVFIRDEQAFVRIELPPDWHSTTILCQDSGLEDVEDALITNKQDKTEEVRPTAFRSVPLAHYPNNQLPLQNKHGDQGDMTGLPHLHEAAMLYNLKERNSLGLPYTRVRDVIVAVNPFKRIDSLYSQETQLEYANKLVWVQDNQTEDGGEERKDEALKRSCCYDESNIEPHIYEVSSLAYRCVAFDRRDQTILVTGESGSGKTETIKLLLQHLASMETIKQCTNLSAIGPIPSNNNGDIVARVLQSSTVLEAFGNARTRRNHNSSRFGKLSQLQYSIDEIADPINKGECTPICCLIGSTCTTYLLEKTRVVSHAVGERSFHIFYQLLAAPEDFKRRLWDFFVSERPTHFAYLAQFGECDVEDLDDTKSWQSTLAALSHFSIEGELLVSLMRALAAVLQLGNIKFSEGFSDSGERETIIHSKDDFKRLSEMLGLNPDEFELSLTSRAIKTNFEELRAPHPPAVAKEAIDALAKEIYMRIFRFIVRQTNVLMKATEEDDVCGTISLVDIYGFERLAINRFEQLCINYANEQLQQKYVADNFRILKEEYDEEGIDIFDFSLVDNSDILNLLDGPSGVFVNLQEECTRPMGNDASFVEKMKYINGSHSRLINEALHSPTEFGVRHYAGPVTYDAKYFVERNTDSMPNELLESVSKSSNRLIADELQHVVQKQAINSSADTSWRKLNGFSLLEKFSTELRDLLVEIEGTQTRYIRCIIPNDTMAPGVTNHLMALRQLEYAGLMTSVALTRESLPDSLSYDDLLRLYSCLLKQSERENMRQMVSSDQIVFLLTALFRPLFDGEPSGAESMPFACGRTKVYLRAGALEHLEELRYNFYFEHATRIQASVRKRQCQVRFNTTLQAALLIQVNVRIFLAKQEMESMLTASLTISSWLKDRVGRISDISIHNDAASTIQWRWFASSARGKYKTLRRGVLALQRIFRRIRHQQQTLLNDIRTQESKTCDRCVIEMKEDVLLSFEEQIADPLAAEENQSGLEALSKEYIALEDECAYWKQMAEALSSDLEARKASSLVPSTGTIPATTAKSAAEFVIWEAKVDEQAQALKEEVIELKVLLQNKEAKHLDNLRQHEEEANELKILLQNKETEHRRLEEEVRFVEARREEAITETNELQEAHLEELEMMEAKLIEVCDENATLKGKLQRQEDNARSEKQELCKMLQEAEESYLRETQALSEDVKGEREGKKRLKQELELLEVGHATKIAALEDQMRQMLDENANLRAELQTKEEKHQEAISTMRDQMKKSSEKHKQDQCKLQTLHADAVKAQRNLKSNSKDETKRAKELEELEHKHAFEISRLKTEIALLQKDNETLEAKHKEESERLTSQLKVLEMKYVADTSSYEEELERVKESQRLLRLDFKKLQTDHAEEQEKMMTELINSHSKETELSSLQERIRSMEESSKAAKEKLREALEAAQNKHQEETKQLKEELFWAEESQRQLQSEIRGMEACHSEELDKLTSENGTDKQQGEELLRLKERLERQEANSRVEKEELCKMLKDAEERHRQDVQRLQKEIHRGNEAETLAKFELQKAQASHAEELKTIMTDSIKLKEKDEEIASLKEIIQQQENHFVEEKERLRVDLKAHLEEVRTLKEQFVESQEAEMKHLLLVMDVLQSLNEQRSKEFLKLDEDFSSLRVEYEEREKVLRTEYQVNQTRDCLPKLELPTISEVDETSMSAVLLASQVDELRSHFADSSSSREAHLEEFNATHQKLQLAVKPDNLKYIIRKLQNNRDSTAADKVFGEIHRMSQALGHLYTEGQTLQKSSDDTLLALLDRYSSDTNAAKLGAPDTKKDNILEDLQKRVAAIEKENETLKQQLELTQSKTYRERLSTLRTNPKLNKFARGGKAIISK